MYIYSVTQQLKSEAGRLILSFLDPTQLDTHKRACALALLLMRYQPLAEAAT